MATISETIIQIESNLKLAKKIKVKFPKATVTGNFGTESFYFASVEANELFDNYDIDKTSSWLKFKPYYLFNTSIDNVYHQVKIYTKPYANTLAEIRRFPKKPSVMHFLPISRSFSTRKVSDKFIDACAIHIISYIKENQAKNIIIDEGSLDPRIKKLLPFI